MENKFLLTFKQFFKCKLCWQFTILLVFIVITVQALVLIPFYLHYRYEQITLFEQSNLQLAKILVEHSNDPYFTKFAKYIMKYSSIRGGTIYNMNGVVIQQFGQSLHLTATDFKHTSSINNEFYKINKNLYYILWNNVELGQPAKMTAVIDMTKITTLWIHFIKNYWDKELLLLISILVTTFILSNFFSLDPFVKFIIL